MNWPFRFTFAATNDYGVLWNPWGGAVGGTTKDNLIFTALVDPALVDMNPPLGVVYVMGLTADTDSVGDASFSLGYYDITAGAFVKLYDVLTTAVAGGGIAYTFPDSGIRLPLSATRVACIRHNGSGAANLCGSLHLFVPYYGYDAATTAADNPEALLDESSLVLLDETSQVLYQG